MILIENRNYLRFRNRSLITRLSTLENSPLSNAVVEPSRSGEPTLKVQVNQSFQYVHSRYNPVREAESLVSRMGDMENYDHILFIGAGLGYAVKAFASAYPKKKISLFEPDKEVLIQFLSYQKLDEGWADQLTFISDDANEAMAQVKQRIDKNGERFFFFVLPFYEEKYPEQICQFLDVLKESLIEKKEGLITDLSFQQRWIINAVKNFPKLIATPNILQDIDKTLFRAKPAIIVSAGPSLNDEFDHLRQIKQQGSAYIFAVGSAINALIKQDIMPDAACTYDPKPQNYRVIQVIKDKKIKSLPLIFGSTVGFETLADYDGPMLHMINSQDTVSPLLLRRANFLPTETVNDAPSIAVIAFQMLLKLEADPIILVGQNLAYLDDKFYASGISYENRSENLNENDEKKAMNVKSVDGKDVITNQVFNTMRKQLEMYIQLNPDRHVINTTKGGAAIAGAAFISLDKVIKGSLVPATVVPNWYKSKNQYMRSMISKKVSNLAGYGRDLSRLFEKLIKSLRHLKEAASHYQNPVQLSNEIDKVNHDLQKVQKNAFYKSLVVPMMKVQVSNFNKKSEAIRAERDVFNKTQMILREMEIFLNECFMNYKAIYPSVEELTDRCK
ncbi:motility associated factor glycosyltransferase family protein [Sporolactobacillus pectinivorans]|uniref:motility associated factor glycosyltransferase family protein n=1 Tax=Sporolactobacillus pectinivorans TaxID=1591408 RepID=UPI000C257262|nr:6-hydroxymethylpterin diphosphokinase MptE-like protein [Sporolactobacillus pectinivorans]